MGQSQYDVLRHHIEILGKVFEELGFKTCLIDLMDEKWSVKLNEAVSTEEIYFFLGLNGMGIEITSNEKSIYTLLNKPFMGCFGDSPIYHYDRLETGRTLNKDFIACFVDKNHINYVSNIHGNGFLKKFIASCINTSIKSDPKPIRERKIDILFSGTYKDPDKIRESWIPLGKEINKLMISISEQGLYQTRKDLSEVAKEVIQYLGMDMGWIDKRKFAGVLVNIDEYVRNYRRKKVIESLTDVPLKLYGNGWEFLDLRNSKIEYCGPGNILTTNKLMEETKIVLNVFPYWTNGIHERILNTIAKGAVSLSDNNSYLTRHFKEDKDILFYDFEDNISRIVNEKLENPVLLQEIVNSSKEKLLDHSLQSLAKELIKIVDLHYFLSR